MAPKAKTFKQLQDEWYARLRRGGFVDIEDAEGRLIAYSTDHTKPPTHGSPLYARLTPQSVVDLTVTLRESNQEYFRLAGQFYYSHKFDSLKESKLWKMHSEGATEKDILKELKRAYKDVTHNKIRAIIVRLRNLMLGGL